MATYLTDRFLETTRCEVGRKEIWDALVPGFGVRVTARQKSFFYVYRSPTALTANGSPLRRRIQLGEYPADRLAKARALAAEIRDQVESGFDPYHVEEVEEPDVLSFETLALDYLERYAKKRKRSWQNDVRIVCNSLLPAWGERPAAAITAKDVRRLLEAIAERTPVHANRVHATLRSVFNWGVSRWDLETNPGRMVSRLNPELPRERVLTGPELAALWSCWNGPDRRAPALLKLRLLTAQRGNQILQMHERELQAAGDDLWWNVPSSSTKTRRPNRILLTQTVQGVLRALPRDGSGFCFGEDAAQLEVFRHDLWKRAIACSSSSGVENWQPRDLRRTAATLMAQAGVSRFILKRVLGHADRDITAVYDLYSYDREVQDALRQLEAAVLRLVGESVVS